MVSKIKDYNIKSQEINKDLLNLGFKPYKNKDQIIVLSKYCDPVTLLLESNKKNNLLIQLYDISKSKQKDKRLEFIRITMIKPKKKYFFSYLLDTNHTTKPTEDIHLNLKIESKVYKIIEKEYSKSDVLKKIDHMKIEWYNNISENWCAPDYNKTFIKLLDLLGQNAFLDNFNNWIIYKCYSSNNPQFCEEIKNKLKEFIYR
jgi:hypothetical protein